MPWFYLVCSAFEAAIWKKNIPYENPYPLFSEQGYEIGPFHFTPVKTVRYVILTVDWRGRSLTLFRDAFRPLRPSVSQSTPGNKYHVGPGNRREFYFQSFQDG